ncbi:MAG: Fe-S cluster assembly ATPase SufC [Nanoarchaeota archaeon]
MKNELIIKDLHINVEGKEIVKGLNLEMNEGEIVALMGPNGSGKSSLANVIMGNPRYQVTKGKILYKGKNILELKVDERAKLGLFLSFQYPQEIPGVTLSNFLRTAYNSLNENKISLLDFKKLLEEKMSLLKMDKSFMSRYLNEGFSGGEKKRAEILQLAVLNPQLAILDETDSGADIDSLKTIANGINSLKTKEKSFLLITHYNRILRYIKPDRVYVMVNGKIVDEGSSKLADEIEEKGYKKYIF